MSEVEQFKNRILAVLGCASLVSGCGGETTRGPAAEGSAGTSGATTVGAGGTTALMSSSQGGYSSASVSTVASATDGVGNAGAVGVAGCQFEWASAPQECPPTLDELWYEPITRKAAELLCDCPATVDSGWEYQKFYACFTPPPGTDCGAIDPACPSQYVSCGLFFKASTACGPLPDSGGQCCYVFYGSCAIGRPFVVEGRARYAPLVSGAGFAADLPVATGGVCAKSQRALADAFTQDAITEHASMAAFARFVLECLALGAPWHVVSGAQQALSDELEHARLCAGLARAYGAPELRPGPLDTAGAVVSADVARVAEQVARESCIAETVSALLLWRASEAAVGPCVKSVLARMARDEMRHALLGFEFLRWALDQGTDEVRFRITRAFADAERAVGFGARTSIQASETELRAHGYLPLAERESVAAMALAEIVVPCAHALLSRAPHASSSCE